MEVVTHAAHNKDDTDMSVFQPPIVRCASELRRGLFSKTLDLAAASVQDNRNITRYRKALEKSRDVLRLDRYSPVASDPDQALAQAGRRCLILRPGISATAPTTWSETLKEGVRQGHISIVPFQLRLGYEYWNARELLGAILPEDLANDLPSSFNTAGHVAHLNLRSRHLPFKHIIAQVIVDKNDNVQTVINKLDNVGDESMFRTFKYEVLAGPDNLNVQVHENSCVYRFDYSKVYWNSKLDSEHRRIAMLPEPGEVVCDVMAGIGPFAIPIAKRNVFVWANDLNPDSFASLLDTVDINKVSGFVRPFNIDGRDFIWHAADSVREASNKGEFTELRPPSQRRKDRANPNIPPPRPTRIAVPPTISHFVMNLPAAAISFLPHFKGVYAGCESLFAPHTGRSLPLVHVHCFAVKSDGDLPLLDICERISKEFGLEMVLGDASNDREVSVLNVRDVAPNKTMFCASFRLPAEIAFAPRHAEPQGGAAAPSVSPIGQMD